MWERFAILNSIEGLLLNPGRQPVFLSCVHGVEDRGCRPGGPLFSFSPSLPTTGLCRIIRRADIAHHFTGP